MPGPRAPCLGGPRACQKKKQKKDKKKSRKEKKRGKQSGKRKISKEKSRKDKEWKIKKIKDTDILFFFVKNFFYKIIQPQIGKRIETSLKTCLASNITKIKNTYECYKN